MLGHITALNGLTYLRSALWPSRFHGFIHPTPSASAEHRRGRPRSGVFRAAARANLWDAVAGDSKCHYGCESLQPARHASAATRSPFIAATAMCGKMCGEILCGEILAEHAHLA